MALQLHDLRDAEAFVAAIANRSELDLSWSDREDLEQFLLETCWELSLRYDPTQNRSFSAFAVAILKRRVFDWQRSRQRANGLEVRR